MTSQWPFVGRDAEFRRLRELLTDSTVRAVVLAGPSGVGKTRLAAEGLAAAERVGMTTVRVLATRAAAGIPLGAFAPFLPVAVEGGTGGIDERAQLLRRSEAALIERAGALGLVVFVDDAHHLDGTSATLVYQLAATGGAVVLATVRTGEVAPDPVVALWKDGLAERLDILGLDVDAVERLLVQALGGPVDQAAATRLTVQSEGNTLFLRELVLGALRDHTLVQDEGIWRLRGQLSPSDRLVELIEARLAGLTPSERGVLEAVSYGEPLGVAELGAVGTPALATALERKGLLSSRRIGRRLEVRLAHPIYGEVLRARMPLTEVPDIARRLAGAVEASGGRRRNDILRVATWRLDEGDIRPDKMLAAAMVARSRYDLDLAERLVAAAREGGAGFDAALLSAQLAGLQGRGDEAERCLEALAGEATLDHQRGLTAVARLDLLYNRGRLDEAVRVAQEAETEITDPAWCDEIIAKRSGLLESTEGPRAALEAAEPLLDRASGRALVWASMVCSYSYSRVGRIMAALDATARGEAAHMALTSPLEWQPWIHMVSRCEALNHAGCLDEAAALATAQYQLAVQEGSAEAQAYFAWQLATAVADRGGVSTAIRHGREAVALARQLDRPQLLSVCLAHLALAFALGGRVVEARRALSARDDLDIPSNLYYVVDVMQARAWTAVSAGDLSRASAFLEEAATIGARIGDHVGQVASIHGQARIGHAKEAARQLDNVEEAEGELVSARLVHIRALAARDPEQLEQVAEAFDRLGAFLLAAEAAADASVAWRRSNDVRRAKSAERRAQACVLRCEGAATPALQAVEARARLTQAERETALLAADGRSNKQIADALYVSLRTVEGQLQRVYHKLGISSRGELAAALEADAIGPAADGER